MRSSAQTSNERTPEGPPRGRITLLERVRRFTLVCTLSLLTVNVWTGGPLLALWVGSRVQGSGPPSMAAVASVAGTLLVVSLILVKALALAGDRYDRLVGRPHAVREPAPWLRSLRGERSSEREHRAGISIFEGILVLSVVAAVAAFEVWFFFFSGSPIGGGSGR